MSLANVCKTCFVWLCQVRRIHHSLDVESVKIATWSWRLCQRGSQTSCNGSERFSASDHRNPETRAWSFTDFLWWPALADYSTAGAVQACSVCSLVSSVPSSKVPLQMLHVSLRSFQPLTSPFGQPLLHVSLRSFQPLTSPFGQPLLT